MLKWYFTTQNEYDAIENKNNDTLYAVTDTGVVYRGADIFLESIELYGREPKTQAIGRLYVNRWNLEAKVWDGTDYVQVLEPVAVDGAPNADIQTIVDFLDQSLDDKMNKVDSGHSGEVIISDGNGNAKLSGYTIGKGEFSSPPKANVLATEAGINHYMDNYSIAKEDLVHVGELSKTVEDASDNKIVSEKAIVDALTFRVLN